MAPLSFLSEKMPDIISMARWLEMDAWDDEAPTFIMERYSAAIGSFDAVAVLLDGHHVDTGAALKHDDTYAKGKLFVSPEQRAILLDLYRIGEPTECFFTQTYAVVVIRRKIVQ